MILEAIACQRGVDYSQSQSFPMKILKILSAVVAVVFLVVFAGSLVLPKSYQYERSFVINAPAQAIFPLVGELRNWPEWSPWIEMDPEMRVTYGTTTTGVGGNYHWAGETAGSGIITISEFDPPKGATFEMQFKGWEDSPSFASFTLSPEENSTHVTWSFAGEFHGNPIKRYYGILMEKMVGENYEKGLANLKQLAEKE